jgi:hypothetical protein
MPLYVAKRVWDWLLKKWIKVVGDFTHLTFSLLILNLKLAIPLQQ